MDVLVLVLMVGDDPELVVDDSEREVDELTSVLVSLPPREISWVACLDSTTVSLPSSGTITSISPSASVDLLYNVRGSYRPAVTRGEEDERLSRGL